MRVLWVVNDVLEQLRGLAVNGKPTFGGSWLTPLFRLLVSKRDVEVGIVIPVVDGKFEITRQGNVRVYFIPIKKGDNQKRLKGETIDYYLKVFDEFSPALIHFHGTEKNFGLLREYVNPKIPMVGSIQGIIVSYLPYLSMSSSEGSYSKCRSIKNWLGVGGIASFKRKWSAYEQIEKDIYKKNKYFFGRTLWDKSQALSLNPQIQYFHGEELLREPFYKSEWNIETCERHSIFISSGAYPIKGLHILVSAIRILKSKYPKLKIYVPLFEGTRDLTLRDRIIGEEYQNYIKKLVRDFGLIDNFVPLKRLNAEEMAIQFAKSHVFVLPSFIENSPNSLGEAMMVGVPNVSAFTGGVGSMVKDEDSSLFFPIGDFRTLAYQIERIFEDDSLALKISKNAKLIAQRRHSKEVTYKQYISAYKRIISIHNESSSSI